MTPNECCDYNPGVYVYISTAACALCIPVANSEMAALSCPVFILAAYFCFDFCFSFAVLHVIQNHNFDTADCEIKRTICLASTVSIACIYIRFRFHIDK